MPPRPTSNTCKKRTCTRVPVRARHGYCTMHARIHKAENPVVDANTTANNIRQLYAQGWTQTGLAQATGVSDQAIREIINEQRPTVSKTTADAIANIIGTNQDAGIWRQAWPTTRRVRSLQAAGWSQVNIARATGLDQTTISKVSRGCPYVTKHTATPIHALYSDHADDPVTTPNLSARAHGWVPPMWWDDIDDPDEQPGVTHCIECHQPAIKSRGRCPACYARLNRVENREEKNAAA